MSHPFGSSRGEWYGYPQTVPVFQRQICDVSPYVDRGLLLTKRRLSQKELIELVGKSRQTVAELCRLPGVPRVRKQNGWLYLWPDFNDWWRDLKIQQATDRATPANFDLAQARKMEADADLAELTLAKLRGELIAVADYRSALAGSLDCVRARLLGLDSRLAPLVVGVENVLKAKALIRPIVNEVLTELSEHDDAVLDEAEVAA